MEDLIILLAPFFTVALPALASRLRRSRRGTPPSATAVELQSGERIDLTASGQGIVREQIDTVLEVASLPGQPAPTRLQRFVFGLNIKITPLQIVYGIVMLIGIAAKEVWDYDRIHGRLGFQLSNMTLALLIAPIVYTAVQPQLAPLHESLTLVGIGVAFQNGFFWQSVFATVQGSAASH